MFFLSSIKTNLLGAVKTVLFYGAIGLPFLVALLLSHPELTYDAMVTAVLIVLTLCWAWSHLLRWVLQSDRPTSRTDEKILLPSMISFAGAFLSLFLLPSFGIAGFVLSFLGLSVCAQVAFSVANMTTLINGVVFCAFLISAQRKKTKMGSFPSSDGIQILLRIFSASA